MSLKAGHTCLAGESGSSGTASTTCIKRAPAARSDGRVGGMRAASGRRVRASFRVPGMAEMQPVLHCDTQGPCVSVTLVTEQMLGETIWERVAIVRRAAFASASERGVRGSLQARQWVTALSTQDTIPIPWTALRTLLGQAVGCREQHPSTSRGRAAHGRQLRRSTPATRAVQATPIRPRAWPHGIHAVSRAIGGQRRGSSANISQACFERAKALFGNDAVKAVRKLLELKVRLALLVDVFQCRFAREPASRCALLLSPGTCKRHACSRSTCLQRVCRCGPRRMQLPCQPVDCWGTARARCAPLNRIAATPFKHKHLGVRALDF